MSPREAISIAGHSLDGRLGDDFATVIAAIHDPARGALTSSAGHPPPLVLGPSAHKPLSASSAPPIDQQLVDLVVRRADGVRDDLAAVVLHATADVAAPLYRVEQLKLDVLDTNGPDADTFLRAGGIRSAERRIVGLRASEQVAVRGGVIVAAKHPQADVSPIAASI